MVYELFQERHIRKICQTFLLYIVSKEYLLCVSFIHSNKKLNNSFQVKYFAKICESKQNNDRKVNNRLIIITSKIM